MNTPILTGPMRILSSWRRRRNEKELPIVKLPASTSYDDVEFYNDMLYLDGLLTFIQADCIADPDTRLRTLSPADSAELDTAIEMLAAIRWEPVL